MKHSQKNNSQKNNSQSGAIIVFVAIMGVVLIQFIALAVDTARLYISQLEMKANSEYAAQIALFEFAKQRERTTDYNISIQKAVQVGDESLNTNSYLASGGFLAQVNNSNSAQRAYVFGIYDWTTGSFTVAPSGAFNSINAVRVYLNNGSSIDPFNGINRDDFFKTMFARVFGYDQSYSAVSSLVVVDPDRVDIDVNPFIIISEG